MAKERTGYVFKRRGAWWARVTFSDPTTRDPETGKPMRRERVRKCRTRSEAQRALSDLRRDVEREVDGELVTTFAELAEHYLREYVKAAEFVGDRKVAGMRSADTARAHVEMLRAHFGARLLHRITYGDLRALRAERLRTPIFATATVTIRKGAPLPSIALPDGAVILGYGVTGVEQAAIGKATRTAKGGTVKVRADGSFDYTGPAKSKGNDAFRFHVQRQRSIASVNRELSVLRRMLNVAVQNRWMDENPFAHGDSLISTADEKQRERIITRDEETRLLAACTGPRAHIRAILIAALDTGARRGELLKLTWSGVNLGTRMITFRARHTKTLRERSVRMTGRLRAELQRLAAESGAHPEELVFGIATTIKRGFASVRRIAGVDGLRLHDVRHSSATRLARGGMGLAEVGRILGHATPSTTYRYSNLSDETTQRAADVLDEFNVSGEETTPAENIAPSRVN